jgi:hypothetical protein
MYYGLGETVVWPDGAILVAGNLRLSCDADRRMLSNRPDTPDRGPAMSADSITVLLEAARDGRKGASDRLFTAV